MPKKSRTSFIIKHYAGEVSSKPRRCLVVQSLTSLYHRWPMR
jgi:hypothetical protein